LDDEDRFLDALSRSAANQVVIYGDFACPWSYLASQRAVALEAAGVRVDWRAVDGSPHPWETRATKQRLEQIRHALPEVQAALAAGERFPASPGRYAPFTAAAVSAFAEGCAAGRGTVIRTLLFDGLWMHGLDLNNANALRRLTAPVLMDSASPSAVVREWGMVPDVSSGPVSTAAWHLRQGWDSTWRRIESHSTPWLFMEGEATSGSAAVAALGALVRRLPDRVGLPSGVPAARRFPELPAVSWISQNGGRWLRDAHKSTRRTSP
jgi:2-hydroxychromene-2-carboxylate isomerase